MRGSPDLIISCTIGQNLLCRIERAVSPFLSIEQTARSSQTPKKAVAATLSGRAGGSVWQVSGGYHRISMSQIIIVTPPFEKIHSYFDL
jgi:hypothetical protein